MKLSKLASKGSKEDALSIRCKATRECWHGKAACSVWASEDSGGLRNMRRPAYVERGSCCSE